MEMRPEVGRVGRGHPGVKRPGWLEEDGKGVLWLASLS